MSSSQSITFLGTFPAPYHGMAIATASLADALESHGLSIRRIDLMPQEGQQGFRAKMLKVRRIVVTACGHLFRPPPALILGADAGYGLLLQVLPVLSMKVRGRPVYILHHSVVVSRASTVSARVFTQLAGRDVIHIFQCHRLVREFVESYPKNKSKTMVVSNGHVLSELIETSCATVSPIHETGDARFTYEPILVGHLSNLNVGKGFGAVGDAVKQLADDGLDIRFLIGGSPSDNFSRAELSRLRSVLGDRLVEVGFVRGEAKAQFLSTLDVFAHPSTYSNECYAIAVWEAMALGVPIVAMDAGCLNEAAIGGGGIIVKRQAAREIATAISALLSDGGRASQAAREVALADYGTSLDQIAQLANSILEFSGLS